MKLQTSRGEKKRTREGVRSEKRGRGEWKAVPHPHVTCGQRKQPNLFLLFHLLLTRVREMLHHLPTPVFSAGLLSHFVLMQGC